jgi:hypothetical protein
MSRRHFFKESAMKRMSALLGGALVAAGLTVGAYAQQDGHTGHEHGKDGAEAKAVTIQGELIDTACYTASDGDAKGKGHAKCAAKCMSTGIPAGILPEGSTDANAVMFLLTNPAPLAPYAAQTIKVEGTSHPAMKAIDVKKLYVKDGENWKEVQLKDEHHKMSDGDAKDDGHKDHKH